MVIELMLQIVQSSCDHRVGLADCLECCCGQRVGLADRLEQLWSKSWSGRLSRAVAVIELVWQIV